jgi:hypothetical protein
LKIATTQLNLEYKTLEVYVSGCKPPHCLGCHNSELQSFDCDNPIMEIEYKNGVYSFNLSSNWMEFANQINEGYKFGLVNNLWMMGGEPLDQNTNCLFLFITTIKTLLDKPEEIKFWLFTKYSLEEVPEKMKSIFHYIKTGRYDQNNLSDDYFSHGIKLASINQKIYEKDIDY